MAFRSFEAAASAPATRQTRRACRVVNETFVRQYAGGTDSDRNGDAHGQEPDYPVDRLHYRRP